MKLSIVAFLLTAICAFGGCSFKPETKGDEGKIIVFADSAVFRACQDELTQALERRIDTPQSERVFLLELGQFKHFKYYTRRPNLLLLGVLEDSGQVSNYVRGMLEKPVLSGIQNGIYYLFNKKNPWAQDQLLCVLCANDDFELISRIRFCKDELFSLFKEETLARVSKSLYSKGENRELSKELLSKYGFYLRIQHDYYLVYENRTERQIRLRRLYPDRFFSISWSDSSLQKPADLTEENVIQERIRIGKLFADKNIIYPEYNRFQSDQGIYPDGVMLRGLWGTEANIGGGAFFTCAFKDTISGLIYYLDGADFAPGWEKLPFLQQLETMARTFKTPTSKIEG